MNDDEHKYGIPELKKYPMPDAAHVRSAIRFFNYVTPKYEEELAKAILKRMKEYGMSFEDFTVGEENRFSKYIPATGELHHYGIKGMKWGVRRFQNADGSLTEAGRARYSTGKAGFRRAPKPEMKIYSHEGKRAAQKIKKDHGDTPLQEIVKLEKRRLGLAFTSAFLDVFVGKDGSLIGRDQYNRSGITNTGKQFSVIEPTPGKFEKFLQDHSKRFKDVAEKSIAAEILDANGKKIGYFDLDDKGNKEINANWISINEDKRGNGYATAVLKDAISWAKDNGYEKMTLEVPGDSPDARHIYEKLGFKVVEQLTDEDDIWGGLTAMELDLKELTHYGIKGMKWGIRRYQNPDGTLTEAGKRHYQRQDDRWVKRKADSIEERAYKKSQRELKKVTKKLDKKYSIKNAYERQGRRYMNEYNQNLAKIMNTKVDKLRSPSGRLVKFVAKRGEYGVHMALADPDYDMNKVKQGIWDSGRVAYRTNVVDRR